MQSSSGRELLVHRIEAYVCPRADLDSVAKIKYIPLPGCKTWSSNLQAAIIWSYPNIGKGVFFKKKFINISI
jgi:hypothetical protein